MDGNLLDLSAEQPSGRVSPRTHNFKASIRIPAAGRVTLTAKSPDHAPAAVATSVLALAAAGLVIPLALLLVSARTQLPWWTLLAAATAFAFTMTGETRLVLWYQYGRFCPIDLTEMEGEPTPRADVLIDDEDIQDHGLEVAGRGEPWVTLSWTSSPRSLPGLAMALLILAGATIAPAATLSVLATVVHANAVQAVLCTGLAALAAAACGTVMMIRVEQLERDPVTSGRARHNRWPRHHSRR